VRRLAPETTPQILVSDTVGFITNLPHELVASFRSTLDEAKNGQFLLLVVDASDSQWREQLRVTRETLESIGAGDIATQVVLNKVDRLDEGARRLLRAEMPEALQISALAQEDVDRLRQAIIAAQDDAMLEETLLIPFKMGRILGEVHASARVLDEKFSAQGTTLRVLARPESIDRWRSMLQ
jgi:GTP-binding protein HflX